MATTTQETNPIPPTGIIKREQDALWNTADAVAQRVQLVQQVYRSVMKPETHYGTIPGCKHPSLYKAGSEQLLMTFKLAVNPEVLDLSTEDCARYRVTTHLTHSPTGTYLGSGIGECSSSEAKYMWREAVCEEEFEDTPGARRRTKWKTGKRGAYAVKQVRQDVADVANTVLKMAKKRSQIDAPLTVTAASDIFTQDLEDMEYPVDEGDGAGDHPTEMPQRKSAEDHKPTAAPERRAENATPPTAGPVPSATIHACPDCGEAIPVGTQCNLCGWVPERTKPIKQAAAEEPKRHSAPPSQSARTPQGEKVSDGQAKRFYAIALSNGVTKQEQQQYLKSRWGISTDRDMVKGEMYDDCIAWAEGR